MGFIIKSFNIFRKFIWYHFAQSVLVTVGNGFVNTEWSNGKNFSQRIWNNAQKLADTLNNELAQGFARGETYEKLTKQITDKFETVSRNNAYRLIYTEGTYVMNESSIQGFSEDFEQYEYSVVEDGHACPICTALNGKVFNIKDRVPGVNFPPMHPWCRCSFKIHVDDWNEWLKAQSNKTRAEKVVKNLKGVYDFEIGKSLGAKAKNYKVMDLQTGKMYSILEGSKVQDTQVFAGKGSKVEYRNAKKYVERYGGNVKDWQHVKGVAELNTDDGSRKAEIHWSQCKNIGKFEFFIKKWLDE